EVEVSRSVKRKLDGALVRWAAQEMLALLEGPERAVAGVEHLGAKPGVARAGVEWTSARRACLELDTPRSSGGEVLIGAAEASARVARHILNQVVKALIEERRR